MTKADQLIERGAERLEGIAQRFSYENGIKAKLADELRDDARFLRKLKPSLVAARARGANTAEAETVERRPPRAPSGPQLGPHPKKGSGGGPNPFVVAAAAFAVGIAVAKWIDWRSHAHPKR